MLLLFEFVCLTWWEQLRPFWHSRVYDRTNVLIFALRIYPFHLMLQSMLFRVMNTSIMGTPWDIVFFIEKMDTLEQLCLRAHKSLIRHWPVALQNKFHSAVIFEKSWEPAKDVCTHMFCRQRESIWLGSLWKALGGVAGVRCWRIPFAGRQMRVFLLRRLCPCGRSSITSAHFWCWTPTMVCAVTTPLHSLHPGSPNYGLRAEPDLRSHFTRPQHAFCQSWKKNIFTKNMLIWQNVTYPEKIPLPKMSGLRTVVQ